MAERTFIEDQKLVSNLLNQLDAQEITSGYKLKLYVNPKDGQQWEKYEFELEDYSIVFGLRKYPYPEIDEIIKIVLSSKFMDEVDGACALLFHLEYKNRIEYREKLINEIDTRIKTMEKERFEIIYHRTSLNDFFNKREVLGKTIEEIEIDAQYFRNLSVRANEIREKIIEAKKKQ